MLMSLGIRRVSSFPWRFTKERKKIYVLFQVQNLDTYVSLGLRLSALQEMAKLCTYTRSYYLDIKVVLRKQ